MGRGAGGRGWGQSQFWMLFGPEDNLSVTQPRTEYWLTALVDPWLMRPWHVKRPTHNMSAEYWEPVKYRVVYFVRQSGPPPLFGHFVCLIDWQTWGITQVWPIFSSSLIGLKHMIKFKDSMSWVRCDFSNFLNKQTNDIITKAAKRHSCKRRKN